ncbi:MAG: zinc-dependent alcohol dehydrogenase family protein [Planctomycetes bacterium]|nr:zinc-dependent alcohol dehydrogenase family protein [Planctomycetota bacterium]
MKRVIVDRFGGPETLRVVEEPTTEPGPGQLRVRVTSIGMNHAELMARRGDYKIVSGSPPFTPGLECGGVIDAIGAGVTQRRVGDRVTLGLDTPRRFRGADSGGTYRSHYICDAAGVLPAPDAIPDEQLGAVWLPYLTAWGCLIWKQGLQPGQFVGIPAASSSVGLAAAQVVKQAGGIAIGLTSSPDKVDAIKALPTARFDHLVVTTDRPWHEDLKKITGGHGVDVYLDPVAAGEYLDTEIRTLANNGTIWLYGLLGKPGPVNMAPLLRKSAAIRGWMVSELATVDHATLLNACGKVLDGFAAGAYRQHVGGRFKLDDVREAHVAMERGRHIGKLVLIP